MRCKERRLWEKGAYTDVHGLTKCRSPYTYIKRKPRSLDEMQGKVPLGEGRVHGRT